MCIRDSYNITSYTTTGGGNVVFTSGNIPASPAKIRIFRDTSVDVAKATYVAGSSVKAGDLNANHEQLLFAAQEEQNLGNVSTSASGLMSIADKTKLDGIETAATADQTASEIKTLYEDSGNNNASYIKTQYESNSDTNAFTDAEKTKLAGITAGAGATTFVGLGDTPTNFTGAAGKTVKVNSSGNALEFVTVTTPTQDLSLIHISEPTRP